MKRSIYEERDYPFGQLMLTLRNRIGLTQARLAEQLQISRQAVVEWENGSNHPTASHLKHVILLGVQQHAFASGNEAEEIRALWQVAQQKVLLDESWLHDVLYHISHPILFPTHASSALDMGVPPLVSCLSWEDAPILPSFYGRSQELQQLSQWVLEDGYQVIGVLGLGGRGKSALTITLMHQLASHFDVVLWRSLRDAPSCEELLDHCLQVLDPQPLNFELTSLEQRLELLLKHLSTRRVLLVLDNLDAVLEEGSIPSHLRVGYEDYDHLLHRLAETAHQSCLLFTSREQVSVFASLQCRRAPVHTLLLASLDADACAQLLAEKPLVGSPLECQQLIQMYAGNPLVLQIMAQTIVDLFGGELAPFLAQGEVIFGGLRALLAEQFARLSPVEHSVLLWLALVREPIDIEHLQALLIAPLSRSRVLEALEALLHRSLIKRGLPPGTFTLHSLVLEYTTEQFLTTAISEIEHGKLRLLIEHSLDLASAQQDTRQHQPRLLVAHLLAQVRRLYPERDALEEHLLRLLQGLRGQAEHAQGYGPANLLALLREQGHLRQLDLSLLAIRRAPWQGVEMHDAPGYTDPV